MFIRRITLLAIFMLMTFSLAGCANNDSQPPVVPSPQNENAQPKALEPLYSNDVSSAVPQAAIRLTIYHATKDAAFLVAEQHNVPKSDHPAKTAIELLINGTKNADLVSVMPSGTKLRNIWVKDHIAYVDFNNKLVKNNAGGSAAEILLVAAIVNTLTEFRDVQKVQILVEGKKIDTISGHMDIGEPLSRSEKIIKKQ